MLLDEELLAIDLDSLTGEQPHPLPYSPAAQPYLSTMHSSAITCSSLVPDLPLVIWNALLDSGRAALHSDSERQRYSPRVRAFSSLLFFPFLSSSFSSSLFDAPPSIDFQSRAYVTCIIGLAYQRRQVAALRRPALA